MKTTYLKRLMPFNAHSYYLSIIFLLFSFLFTSQNFAQTGLTCAQAIPIAIDGTCLSSPMSGFAIVTSYPTTCPSNAINERWYSFTVSGGPKSITIEATADKNLALQLVSGTCGAQTILSCTSNLAGSGDAFSTESVTTTLVNGTYFVKVLNIGANVITLNNICVKSSSAACSGIPTAGTTVVAPISGNAGSSYTVSNTGYTNATGLTFQWQYSTNSGTNWANQGSATSTYSNYTATAPALGVVTLWRLVVTCTAGGLSATSNNATFTSISSQNVPASGSNTVACGTNITLYDNGGPSGNYANDSNGFTALEAGTGAIININGSYTTENSWDFIRIYNGVGIGGTLLMTFTGAGTVNYTGNPGQTLTVRFSSDASGNFSGFALSVTYSGVCSTPCSGTPTAGTTFVAPVSGNTGSTYTVSNTGYSSGTTGLTYQWQYSTNSGNTWTNQGTATSTYSNYTATAPAVGVVTLWRLVLTCTASGLSATSNNATFTSTSAVTVPATGFVTVACGNNSTLYDNGGPTGDYALNSSGYVVLQANALARINIYGKYLVEGTTWDYIRIYNGTGTGGAVLKTYSANGGTINYTGNPGQTLTLQLLSDSVNNRAGFALVVTYSGPCIASSCSGMPTGGTASAFESTGIAGSTYIVSAIGYTQATNITYQWQYSTTGAGGTWINAGLATSIYADYSATAPASGTVLWRLATTCSTSSQTATSANATFTVLQVSPTVTGCPSIISGGVGLNGADPAPFNCTSSSTCVDLEATYLNLGNTSSYKVEPITYAPPYKFETLANPVSVSLDDVWSPQVNLPFSFCFYGNTYTNCKIGSNGVVSFNNPSGANNWETFGKEESNLPSGASHITLVPNAIFGVGHDMHPTGTNPGKIGWELVNLPSGCRALVVSWSNVPMFSNDTSGGANNYTGMIVLYENSNIIEIYIEKKRITNSPRSDFQSDTMWNDGNAVIGIQNANGTLATVPPGRNVLSPNWSATNEAWRFVPNGTSITTVKWFEGPTAIGTVLGTDPILNVCPTSTTTYTAEITYTLCTGGKVKVADQTTVTVNKAKTWNGSVDTNWNVANNWTPTGVPTAMDCVVVPDVTTTNNKKPIISGTNYNGLGLNLTINNNADVTITPNNNLIITDWAHIETPTGSLTVEDDANFVQVINSENTNTGNMNFKRTTSIRRLDYVYWSSPVTINSTPTYFPVSQVSPLTPLSVIWKWKPTINGTDYGTWENANEGMVPGKGYIIRGPEGHSTASAADYTATFVGIPNNGQTTVSISRGTRTGSYAAPGNTATQDDDNWNLIGNPYPSSIDAISFLVDSANSNLDGFVRLWRHGFLPDSVYPNPFYQGYVYNYTANDYIAYNSVGSTPAGFLGKIGAGQSFFVLMNHSAASPGLATFNNNMRYDAFIVPYSNNQFYKTSSLIPATVEIEKHRIWMNIIDSNGTAANTLLGYTTGATLEKDRNFDAVHKVTNDMSLYSLIDENQYIIQGRPVPFDQNDIVPLGVSIPNNGNYTIAINMVDGLFTNESQNIYIEDTALGIIYDIKSQPYTFSANTGVFENRFFLRYTNQSLNNNNFESNNTIKVITNQNISINSSSEVIDSIIIYDILGRKLADYKNVNANEFTIKDLQKNNAPLLLKIKLQNGFEKTQKVVY